MKPSWDDAPEWAEYLAMDGDGNWCWFEQEPELSVFTGTWDAQSRFEFADQLLVRREWRDTLEKRP